ncbi:UNVERIFIED_CONTAM: hypothetical protein K2H54_040896 [Gekko kuhli]
MERIRLLSLTFLPPPHRQPKMPPKCFSRGNNGTHNREKENQRKSTHSSVWMTPAAPPPHMHPFGLLIGVLNSSSVFNSFRKQFDNDWGASVLFRTLLSPFLDDPVTDFLGPKTV